MNVYIVIQSSGRPIATFDDMEAAIDYARQMKNKGPSAEVVSTEVLSGQHIYPHHPIAKTVPLK